MQNLIIPYYLLLYMQISAGRGKCFNDGAGTGTYYCKCASPGDTEVDPKTNAVYLAGYSGDNCNVDVNDCVDTANNGASPCFNAGVCTDLVGGFQCTCPSLPAPGWSGKKCEVQGKPCDATTAATCSKLHGSCQKDASGKSTCACDTGFANVATGQQLCEEAKECASSPCANGAVCTEGACKDIAGIVTTNSTLAYVCSPVYTCQCTAGFEGSNCKINKDECASYPCKNGATCVDDVNGYKCSCPPGYTTTECGTDFDECSSSPCKNGGTCSESSKNAGIPADRYVCTCIGGFNGDSCQNDYDECSSSPCRNGGLCKNSWGAYQCQCKTGFTGAECEQDINECGSHPCQNGGLCADSHSKLLFNNALVATGEYKCKCPTGFESANCEVDKDECASSPCKNGARCIDSGTLIIIYTVRVHI